MALIPAMNKPGKRVTIDGSEVTISSPGDIILAIPLVIWLAFWTKIGVELIQYITAGEVVKVEELIFLLIWLCLWVFGEVYFGYIALLWFAYGKESISLEHGYIVIRRSAFGFGGSRSFQVGDISNLRVSAFGGSQIKRLFAIKGFDGPSIGKISFDFKGREVRFGVKLRRDDAELVVNTIKSKFGIEDRPEQATHVHARTRLGKRITIKGPDIIIASPKKVFDLIIGPLWLTGWTAGGVIAVWQLIAGKIEHGILVMFWLCGWLVGEIYVGYFLLWLAVGRETVSLERRQLVIRSLIFGHGKSRRFAVDRISNLRVSDIPESPKKWYLDSDTGDGISGGAISFDYEGRVEQFGKDLEKDDAERLVAQMKSKFGL